MNPSIASFSIIAIIAQGNKKRNVVNVEQEIVRDYSSRFALLLVFVISLPTCFYTCIRLPGSLVFLLLIATHIRSML